MNLSQAILNSVSKVRSNIINLIPQRKEIEKIAEQLLEHNNEMLSLIKEIKDQNIEVKEYNELTVEQKEFFREIDEKYAKIIKAMINLEDDLHAKFSEFACKYPYLTPSLNKYLSNIRAVYRTTTYIFGYTYDFTAKRSAEARKEEINSVLRKLGVDSHGGPTGNQGGNFGGGTKFNLN